MNAIGTESVILLKRFDETAQESPEQTKVQFGWKSNG